MDAIWEESHFFHGFNFCCISLRIFYFFTLFRNNLSMFTFFYCFAVDSYLELNLIATKLFYVFMRTFQMLFVSMLLVVVRQHLIDSNVLTWCPPLRRVSWVQDVIESRHSREIDNIPQITVQFFLKSNNIIGGNTS